jgi:hypothetical protein
MQEGRRESRPFVFAGRIRRAEAQRLGAGASDGVVPGVGWGISRTCGFFPSPFERCPRCGFRDNPRAARHTSKCWRESGGSEKSELSENSDTPEPRAVVRFPDPAATTSRAPRRTPWAATSGRVVFRRPQAFNWVNAC